MTVKLTKRQIQILDHLKNGASNKDLAELIGIAEPTVKVHMWLLLKAIGCKSRLGAVAWWRENGGIETLEQAYQRGVADGRKQILTNIENFKGEA